MSVGQPRDETLRPCCIAKSVNSRGPEWVTFSSLTYMSPFGAMLPCKQGPTEGECKNGHSASNQADETIGDTGGPC